MKRFKAIMMALIMLCSVITMGCGSNNSVTSAAFQQLVTSLAVSPKTASTAPGQTQQFAATAGFNDGTSADVTGLVTWSSSNPAVVTINASTGLATAQSPGSAIITASGAGFTDTAAYTVTVPSGTVANLVALNSTGNGLVRFSSASPSVTTTVAVTGLNANEVLVGLDVRPQNRHLYGLGFNSAAGTVRLYDINPDNGIASVVGIPQSFVGADGVTVVPIAGTGFGFDFNPAVDRLRVVTSTGQNFRINPNTGGFIDGDLGGAVGSVPGINMDGAINGPTTVVDAAAYTNNQPNNGSITSLYTLDGASNSLFLQSVPNAGTESGQQAVTLNGTSLDFTNVNGFDILPGVNTAASNTAVATGSGLAALTVSGTTRLYSINLVNGQATLLGTPGVALNGLAALMDSADLPLIGLTDTGSLTRFNSATPGTTTTVAQSGTIAPGETMVGLDFWPRTGQLIGLGVNATANTGTIYLIDPQTGAIQAIGPNGQVQFTTDGVTPVDFPDPAVANYAVNFNPAADRIRVVTSTGLNFRINPDTAAPVDGDSGVAGVNPDGGTNVAGVPSIGVSGAAYTNAFNGATVTTLYTLNSVADQLFIQNPPNSGTQTLPGNLGVNFATLLGFDIPRSVTVTTANAVATGSGAAALTVGGVTGFYTVNLTTGAATLVGTVGAGATPLVGLTIGN